MSAVTRVFLASLTTQQLVWFGRLTPTGVQPNLLRLCEGLSFTFLLFRFRWANPRLAILGAFAYLISLFHVFGTAGSHMLVARFVIDNRLIQFELGIA